MAAFHVCLDVCDALCLKVQVFISFLTDAVFHPARGEIPEAYKGRPLLTDLLEKRHSKCNCMLAGMVTLVHLTIWKGHRLQLFNYIGFCPFNFNLFLLANSVNLEEVYSVDSRLSRHCFVCQHI